MRNCKLLDFNEIKKSRERFFEKTYFRGSLQAAKMGCVRRSGLRCVGCKIRHFGHAVLGARFREEGLKLPMRI